MYLRHPWCAPPLAQTFPQLAQHVVERGALTHSHDSERSSLCSQRGSLSALCSLRSARSHDFALLASRTRAPLMGGQHHPKECPAQPQPAGLAAHRPQSPYESGVSRHREVARALRQKIQKTQRIEDPYPPLPPPAQCQKFRLYPVKRHRGEPGHTRDTRTHKGTRTAQTSLTTIQTHQQRATRTSDVSATTEAAYPVR
jgi:hypothetical protein